MMKMLQHGGWITEVFVGGAIGVVLNDIVLPKIDGKYNKFMVNTGALVLTWYAARKVHQEYDEWYKAVEALVEGNKN